MSFARADIIIWLIIFLMVAATKVWSKSQEQVDDDPPASTPKPRSPVAKRPPRPRPLPQTRPIPRAVERRTPPVASPRPTETRGLGGGADLRDFMEELQRKLQPQPIAGAPVARAAPPPAPAQPPPPQPPTQKQTPQTSAPAPPQPSRALQWAEALRDKQNIRNIIISAEIIGPPKAFQ
jgi:hypothetical protein